MKTSLRWTVGRQLGLALGAIVLLVLGLAVTSWTRTADIDAKFSEVVEQTLPDLTALSEVNDRLQFVRTAELAHLAALTMPAKDREETAVRAAVKDLNDAITRYITRNPEAKDLVDAVSQFNAARDTFLQMSNSAAGAESERAVEASDYFSGPSQAVYQKAYVTVQKRWQQHVAQASAAKEAGRAAVNKAHTMLLGVSAVTLLASVAFAWVITRRLLRQLGGQPTEVAALAATIADANLASPIVLRLGDTTSVVAAMHRMQQSLSHIVHGVREGATGVALASAEIARGNHDLSTRTEQQASALQETAASMEELSAKVRQNAESASSAKALAEKASNVAVAGGKVVDDVVVTMKGIHDASYKIADIISVIDGIAFQTNILALNAAVEAARAGEQGRGFAVVASEVRSLAGRSAEAAKEIKGLIATSVARVAHGTELVSKAGHTMNQVVAAIHDVSAIVTEISTASRDQSAGVAQIGDAINDMDRGTQQNAALVEEMAAAASQLNAQADELVRVVSIFHTADEIHAPLDTSQVRQALAYLR